MNEDPNHYPPGWNYERAAAVAKHYDLQRDDEIVAEIEAAAGDPSTVLVQVPRGLLTDVLKLIEGARKTA